MRMSHALRMTFLLIAGAVGHVFAQAPWDWWRRPTLIQWTCTPTSVYPGGEFSCQFVLDKPVQVGTPVFAQDIGPLVGSYIWLTEGKERGLIRVKVMPDGRAGDYGLNVNFDGQIATQIVTVLGVAQLKGIECPKELTSGASATCRIILDKPTAKTLTVVLSTSGPLILPATITIYPGQSVGTVQVVAKRL